MCVPHLCSICSSLPNPIPLKYINESIITIITIIIYTIAIQLMSHPRPASFTLGCKLGLSSLYLTQCIITCSAFSFMLPCAHTCEYTVLFSIESECYLNLLYVIKPYRPTSSLLLPPFFLFHRLLYVLPLLFIQSVVLPLLSSSYFYCQSWLQLYLPFFEMACQLYSVYLMISGAITQQNSTSVPHLWILNKMSNIRYSLIDIDV